MINKLTLVGRLGKDPEIKQSPNGNTYAKFSVATSESYKDKSGEWINITQWHNCMCFGKTAEFLKAEKGELVYIEGKVQYDDVEKDGGKVRYTNVIANLVKRLVKNENAVTSYSDEVGF